ncbi:MAG: VanZ family protein, partial [Gemmatimonadota bacterium]|nr:VanZ family protein [Gemmatimonadota bacterium]
TDGTGATDERGMGADSRGFLERRVKVTWPTRGRGRRGFGKIVVALAVVAIAAATLSPNLGPRSYATIACIVCGERGWADAVVNVILFMPLGIGLALASVRARHALLIGALLSALVELAQLTVIAGRDPSIGDVLFNAIGAWLGAGLVFLALEVTRMDGRSAARLSVAAALDLSLAVLATGWLLQPSFPRTAYWGQWTPNLGHLEWYRGKVQAATIAGREVRSRRIAESGWVRDTLLAGGRIEVVATAGPPVPALASLFSIFDVNQQGIIILGPDRDDLVLWYRTHSTAWRLDQPDIRLGGGWGAPLLGSRITVSAWAPSPGTWCLVGPADRTCEAGFTLGHGWGLLFYAESFPPWLRSLLAVGWVAVLTITTGFLLRRRWESAVALVIALAALAVLPGLVDLRPTPVLEFAGAGLGLALGALAGWTLRTEVGGAPPAPVQAFD